jgi:hypothetical protein
MLKLLFNKFRTKKAWMIEAIDIDQETSEIVGYCYKEVDAKLFCRAANQYTSTTRLHYRVLG